MTVLEVRAILNGILFVILFSGAIFLFIQSFKQNGITKAMTACAFTASLYVAVSIVLGYIDICLPENFQTQHEVRYWWNWIALSWILSLAWLGWKLIKEDK